MEVDNEEDINEEEIDEFNDIDELNNAKSADFSQEIATLVSAIGIIDDSGNTIFIRGEYYSSAIPRLEYLLRTEYIKNRRTKDFDDDTDNNEIFNKCGEFMVMSNKLVPCFKQCMQDIIKYGLESDQAKPLLRIVQCLIKMFTRFTFPLTYNTNNTVDNYVNYSKYQHFLEYQQTFKKCLIDNTVLMQIIILMGDCSIDLDPDERSEMDIDLLELYLCLLRNILSIPNRIECDDFLQDRAILAFKEECVMDVLVELSTNIYEECEKIQFLLMDIFYQFFKMEDAESMFMLHNKTNNNSTTVDTTLFKEYRKDKLHRKSARQRRRHKNFGGLSRVAMMNGQSRIQSLGNTAMCNDNMFDRRRQRKFRPVKEKKKRIHLNDTVKHSLMYVADLLLQKSFTPLVNTVYFLLSKKMEYELNQSQNCKKWLKLISVFLKYHRLKTRSDSQKKAKRDGVNFLTLKWYSSSWISCVLKESVVNFIISRINTLFEDRSNKYTKCESHFNRLEETLSCYKEIIRSIYSMMKYGNEVNNTNGIKLFSYIFEDNRGPELIHNMINEYKVHQSTKLCLSYCIEAVYYTDCILQIMCNDGKSISVKSKKKKRKKAKKKNTNTMEVDGEEQELEHDEEKHIVEVAGMQIHDDTDDDDDEMMYNREAFDYDKFMKSYASNKVIAQYMYVLDDYATNSAKLNSYVITLFNALAFKMNYAPLLFQLKYFILFDKILNDKVIAKDKNFNIVRKFCTNIVHDFFKRSKVNKVLFTEILFHKTPHALSDINEPGTVFKQLENKKERDKRRRDRIEIEGDLDDNDFDDEEEYQGLDINMTQWTDEEDNLLRNYYSSYALQANVLNILKDFLENELKKTRSESQIDDRLRCLGLRKGPKKKRKNQQNEAKKRVKPKDMDMNEKKSIIYHCIHRACHVLKLQRDNNENEENAENNEDDANRNVFTWLCSKLDNLCDIVGEVLSAESDILLDDIAIIPVELNEFNYMNNLYLIDLLQKLGFLSPNKYIGTLWWRIPREFKIGEIQNMINLTKEALELPMDANLNDLCAPREQSMDDIALLNDNNLDNNPFVLAAVESENENENDDKKEHSESEAEYQVPAISEMEHDSTEHNEEIPDENAERKKKKKKKKDKKKKKKKDKKDGEDDGNEARKKKKKKKHKSRKRKRDKITKETDVGIEDNDGENLRKRRKLNVNKNNKNEEDSFFDDIASDMEEDKDEDENGNENIIETEMKNIQNMNTPQIEKFNSLTLLGNNNILNGVKENQSEDDDDIIPKRKWTKKSKRAFVSDSDSD